MLKKLIATSISIVLASALYADVSVTDINSSYLEKVIINLDDDIQKNTMENIIQNATKEQKAKYEAMAYSFFNDMKEFNLKNESLDQNNFNKLFANNVAKGIVKFKNFINNNDTIDKTRKLYSTINNQSIEEVMENAKPKSVPLFSYMDFTQGMDFGMAINTLTSEIQTAQLCLNNMEISKPIYRGEKNYKIEIIDSIESLKDAFGFKGYIGINAGAISGSLEGAYNNYKDDLNNNVLVKLAVEIQQNDFNLKAPSLSEEATTLYASAASPDDYERFREKCGDRYLSTITTGGRYVGILKISTNGTEEKEEIEAFLTGVYDPMANISKKANPIATTDTNTTDSNTTTATTPTSTSSSPLSITVEAGFTKSLSDIEKVYNTSIEIISKGGLIENKLVTTVEDFYNSASIFLSTFDMVNENSTYNQSAYLVKFDPYEPITMKTKGGDIAKQNEVINQYIDYLNIYDAYLNKLQYIKRNMEKYVDAEAKDEDMRSLELELYMKKAEIKNLAKNCQKIDPIERECISIENVINTTPFKNEWDLAAELPSKVITYPRTCIQRQDLYPGSSYANKEYRLYMSGNKFKPFSIYCDDMETATPSEYLTLYNISPVTDHPSYNYTRYSQFLDHNNNSVDLVTIYNKIKVKVSYSHISVFDTQNKFLDTVGSSVTDNNDNIYTTAQFANPRNLAANGTGISNIDIVGTGFEISTDTNFINVNNVDEFIEYEYVNSPKNWAEASLYAKSLGGELVSIETLEKNLKLIEFVKTETITEAIWIGASDSTIENQYSWSDGSIFIYTNWAVNNPHNNTTLNCIQMNYDANDEYKWSDKDCNEAKPFIIAYTSSPTIINNISDDRQKAILGTTGKNGNARSQYDFILEYVQ